LEGRILHLRRRRTSLASQIVHRAVAKATATQSAIVYGGDFRIRQRVRAPSYAQLLNLSEEGVDPEC
jgi:hypothetical protein